MTAPPTPLNCAPRPPRPARPPRAPRTRRRSRPRPAPRPARPRQTRPCPAARGRCRGAPRAAAPGGRRDSGPPSPLEGGEAGSKARVSNFWIFWIYFNIIGFETETQRQGVGETRLERRHRGLCLLKLAKKKKKTERQRLFGSATDVGKQHRLANTVEPRGRGW
jgi:hypothetical protein